ncbi:MAG: hypothetical protein IT385_21665 [Deltaproteobacteria bacterium]|nr:hypothetical protein [Deltaproteobacteria bacterium]
MTAAALDELLQAIGAPPGGPDDALELGSLAVLQLVDLIEATTGVVLGSRDVTRASFATRGAVLAMLARRGATCG